MGTFVAQLIRSLWKRRGPSAGRSSRRDQITFFKQGSIFAVIIEVWSIWKMRDLYRASWDLPHGRSCGTVGPTDWIEDRGPSLISTFFCELKIAIIKDLERENLQKRKLGMHRASD